MKFNLPGIATAVLALLVCLPLSGQVVEDTNILLSENNGFGNTHRVGVATRLDSQFSSIFDLDQMFFSLELIGNDMARLDFVDLTLAARTAWYTGDHGQPFTAEAILNDEVEIWGGFEQTNPFVSNSFDVAFNESFFVAVNATDTDQGLDSFGWVEWIVDDSGNLTMLDNAIAYNSSGILIGKNQAVPEPAATLLLGPLLGLVAFRRKRS